MNRTNLSEWALRHQSLVLYVILALLLTGAWAYTRLGQSEDPPFTFKIMVVRTGWPGATAAAVGEQITDRIEKKLQDLDQLEYLGSYSKSGESVVFVVIEGSAPPAEMPAIWYQVRKKIQDIRHTLPSGIEGPTFNDEFGVTFSNVYALTGDGYSYADLKRHADAIRQELLRVPDVSRVEYFGEQEQRVYVEFSTTRLATLGIDVQTLAIALGEQNAVTGTGAFDTDHERIHLRISGEYDAVAQIGETLIRAGERTFRLADIATVHRGYVDPPKEKMRFLGQEALGIGVAMRAGGDVIRLGHELRATAARIEAQLPVGLSLVEVSSQPQAVERSVNEFLRSLAEAVIIVLGVSLLSLGSRTGIVVAVSIPVVLAATFLCMHLFGIGLHKISLGALVLALGLLVDDAIIAVEMMATKMQQGWERHRAAAFAYTSTAMPMLSGTLVTAAGFLPIATAASTTGEYTRSLFQVTVIALLISWIAAVIFIPYLGFKLLPATPKDPGAGTTDEHAHYDTRFYRAFRRVVALCVDHRWPVIALTLAAFVTSLWAFRLVPQQFFPDSTRPELLVDLRLPEGSSYAATEAEVRKMESILAAEPGIEHFVAWVGVGSPRFYLPLDQQLPNLNFAQFVVLTKGSVEREALRAKLLRLFENDFTLLRGNVRRLENGPPVGFPVQFRVSGDDIPTLKRIANSVAEVMRAHPDLADVQFDWDERSKAVRIEVDQEKARLLGVSSSDLAGFLDAWLHGLGVTQFRERNELIDVALRGDATERADLARLPDLPVPTATGRSVPLSQIARIGYGFEDGVIWRRDRSPTITARANVLGDVQAPSVSAEIEPRLDAIRANLPLGYRIETGGAAEESAKGSQSVAAGVPLLIVVVLTVLMIQLQSFSRVTLVVLTAPLGIIGVTAFLLGFGKPFGFVAMLGTIALSGMIMRNSVILVDQIDQDRRGGRDPHAAIVDATVRRLRPIALTAAAAILAMVPLTRSAFFGPMAVAIMGGLTVATVLTLLFLPALYAAWFRVPHTHGCATSNTAAPPSTVATVDRNGQTSIILAKDSP
jgi:multidrug efflux pump